MRLQKTIQIDAPAEKVWETLWMDYGKVCEWATPVNHSNGRKVKNNANGGRTCHSTWGEISEIVDLLDEKNMTYRYYADGLPKMMRSAKNTWKVNSTSKTSSEVSIDLDIEFNPVAKVLMGWMMIPKMKQDVNQTITDLKIYLETGKQSEPKIKSDEKFFKKNPQFKK